MTNWKYANKEGTVVSHVDSSGRHVSCLTSSREYLEWLAAGNTPEPAQTAAEIAAEVAALKSAAALAALAAIDAASIRSIREYIASKPDAPQILKDYEVKASTERSKLKPKVV